MNQVTTTEQGVVIVAPQGGKASERMLDVVNTTQNPSVLDALLNAKGKVGKCARERKAHHGAVDIVRHAASGNYRPLAEYLAALTGDAVVISGRSTFEALPDFYEQRVIAAQSGKNGGMKIGADSVSVAGPKLALALRMKAICVDAVRGAAELHAQRAAAKALENSAAE